MAHMITICPSCRHSLTVTELECPHCQITMRGRFDGHPSLALDEDQLAFLRVFVVSRGNLKEIERLLGVSYPTVRSKLDQLVEAFHPDPQAPPRRRRDILERVAKRELTVAEGLTRIGSLTEPEEGHDDEPRD